MAKILDLTTNNTNKPELYITHYLGINGWEEFRFTGNLFEDSVSMERAISIIKLTDDIIAVIWTADDNNSDNNTVVYKGTLKQ